MQEDVKAHRELLGSSVQRVIATWPEAFICSGFRKSRFRGRFNRTDGMKFLINVRPRKTGIIVGIK